MHKTEITTAEALEIVKECIQSGDEINQHLVATVGGSNWSPRSVCFGDIIACRVKFYRRTPTHIINGFEVEKGVSEPLVVGELHWIEDPNLSGFALETEWCNSVFDSMRLARGLIHLTKEPAVASCKARLGIDPYAEE